MPNWGKPLFKLGLGHLQKADTKSAIEMMEKVIARRSELAGGGSGEGADRAAEEGLRDQGSGRLTIALPRSRPRSPIARSLPLPSSPLPQSTGRCSGSQARGPWLSAKLGTPRRSGPARAAITPLITQRARRARVQAHGAHRAPPSASARAAAFGFQPGEGGVVRRRIGKRPRAPPRIRPARARAASPAAPGNCAMPKRRGALPRPGRARRARDRRAARQWA